MLASQGCVHSRECFELVGHLVRVVQRHLDQLVAIQGHTNTFAADVGRVHKVCQDGLVHSSQSARHWAHLSLGGLAGLAGLLVLDLTLGHEDDVLAREFLLELTHKSHLVLAEQVLETVWDEDDDGSSALVDNDFLGTSDVQVLQERAELLIVDLEVHEGLGDLVLELCGLSLFLLDLLACSKHSNQTATKQSTYLEGRRVQYNIDRCMA